MKGVCQVSGWPHQVRLRKTGAAACVGRQAASILLDALSACACGAAIQLRDTQVHRARERAQTGAGDFGVWF